MSDQFSGEQHEGPQPGQRDDHSDPPAPMQRPIEEQTPVYVPSYSPSRYYVHDGERPAFGELYQDEKPLLPDYDGPRGNPLATAVSWFVIIGVTLVLFLMTAYLQLFGQTDSTTISQSELMQVNLQGRLLVAQSEFAPVGVNEMSLDQFNMGPPEQRFCYAILLNEFDGADAAFDEIEKIDQLMKETPDFTPSDDQTKLLGILRTLFDLYRDHDFDVSNALSEKDQQFLVSQLSWSGQLALSPANGPNTVARSELVRSAQQSFFVLIGAVIVLGLTLLAGVVGAVILLILVANGNLRSRFRAPSGRGGIYAETFAIWMLVFVGLQVFIGLMELQLDETVSVFVIPVIFFLSLGVLIWPVIRGLTFSQVCEDIGWRFGNPFLEGPAGGVSYVSLMPFVGLSFIFMFLILIVMGLLQPAGSEFSSAGAGGHPIQDQIAGGSFAVWIGVFLTACVAAPIVEETMFRGVLYRHLRDMTAQTRALSVFLSAVINGFIFAAVHPQGLMGIPMLTTLAIGFSLAREWRDSLVAPMVMHGINNAIVTCLLMAII